MNIGDLVDSGFAEIRTGPFGTQLKASDYVASGRPVLNVRNVGLGDVRGDKLEYVDEPTAARLSGHVLRTGDIVFGRKGAVERHAFIKNAYDGALQGSDCIRLRISADSPVQPAFVTFALRTREHQAWMQSFCSHGATMASLNQDILRKLPLPDVDRAEQDLAIAVLQTIDDLIENNRRRIEVLEEMAGAIYREWFVNFRYPGHENATFIDSPLGPIPEGWHRTTLGKVLELRYGKALKKDNRHGGVVAVVSSAGIVGWHNEQLVEGPTIVLGRKGNIGSVTWVEGPCWPIDTAYFVVTGLPLRYVAEQLRRTKFLNTHAAVPGLSREQVYSKLFLSPPDDLMFHFAELSSAPASQSLSLARQCKRLALLRDLLLPRLVTGQIDVSSLDLDALVEDSVA